MGNIWIQIIGFIGAAVFVASYQIKSNRLLFLFQLLGSGIFCFQFFLMSAWSGCLSLAVFIIRDAMLYKYRDWNWVRWKGWPMIISAVFVAILFITWNGPISFLPLAAAMSSTFGYWTNNAQNIRLANLVCASPCWLIYDVLVMSLGGVLCEAITLASILLSVYRFGWANMKDDREFQS